MKEYSKPEIKEEPIEIEDICSVSSQESGSGKTKSISDLVWGNES